MDVAQIKDALGPLADQVDVDALKQMLSDPTSVNAEGLKKALGPLGDKVDIDGLVGKIKSGDISLDSLKETFGGIDADSVKDAGGLLDKAKGLLGGGN